MQRRIGLIRRPHDWSWRACRPRHGGDRKHCAPRGLCAGLHRRVLADCLSFAARYSARAPAALAAAEPADSIAPSYINWSLISVGQPGSASSRNPAGKAQRLISGRFPFNRFSGAPFPRSASGHHEASVSTAPSDCYGSRTKSRMETTRCAAPGQDGPPGDGAPRSTRAMMPFWAASATV